MCLLSTSNFYADGAVALHPQPQARQGVSICAKGEVQHRRLPSTHETLSSS